MPYYAPKPPPSYNHPQAYDPETRQIINWIMEELRAISRAAAETTELELRPSGRAPEKPREGMIVFADGTNWDPGGGKGAYVYHEGTGWVKMT